MAFTPQKPVTPAAPPRPAQGSVDPKEHPHSASHPGAVTISHAPPLPTEQPTAKNEEKPVMETGDAEQKAGKTAMEMWKKRQAAEEEAGKAALQRHASLRPPLAPKEHEPEQHDLSE